MTDSAMTRPSLLLRIRDSGDRQAWGEFVEAYAPLVYGFCRKHGLQDADGADLTQDVLQAVSAAIARLDYDPRRGSFRGWLFTLARNRLYKALARRQREFRGSGDPFGQLALEELADREDGQRGWLGQEDGQRGFALAAAQVRGTVQDKAWRAFWLTAVEGKSGKEAAHALGISAAAVYLAKRRVTLRVKEEIQRLEGD